MKLLKRLERFWDNGMLSLRDGANRFDSIFTVACMLYINLLIGIFYFEIYYPTILFGIFCLILDNHNLNKPSHNSEEVKK